MQERQRFLFLLSPARCGIEFVTSKSRSNKNVGEQLEENGEAFLSEVLIVG